MKRIELDYGEEIEVVAKNFDNVLFRIKRDDVSEIEETWGTSGIVISVERDGKCTVGYKDENDNNFNAEMEDLAVMLEDDYEMPGIKIIEFRF